MLARTDNIVAATANWLAQFERALAERDDTLLGTTFHRDSPRADVLALTWRITTIKGSDAILRELRELDQARPADFRIAANRTPPRHVSRAGIGAIEAIFTFETATGRGS